MKWSEIWRNVAITYNGKMSYIFQICQKISDVKDKLFIVEFDDKTSYHNGNNQSDAYEWRKLNIIGSDNGLSLGRRQAIIWTSAGILVIGLQETNFSEILIESYTFLFKKINLIMSSGKWRLFCLGLNVFIFAASGSNSNRVEIDDELPYSNNDNWGPF